MSWLSEALMTDYQREQMLRWVRIRQESPPQYF